MKKKLKIFWAWLTADKKRLLAGAIILILLLAGGLRLLALRGNAKTQFQTATVEKGTLVSTISASGKAITTGVLSITTEASGIVKAVYVKDGDFVFAGQKIAEITLDQAGLQNNASSYASYINAANGLNSANNSYRSAQASAEKVLDEVKGHDQDETLTQKETRTRAEVARDNAYDGIRSAEANLTVASLNYRTGSPVITAPFAGEASNLELVEGMVIGGNSASDTTATSQRVAVVKSQTAPIVSVTLSEIDVPKIKVGQKATIVFDSLGDKTFTGKVVTVDRLGQVTNNVVGYSANIKLDSPSEEILPNMAATANIILDTKSNVLLVPSTAIISQNGESFARVLKNGQEEQVAVEAGLASDSQTEIISGLNEGDVVISGTTSSATSTAGQTRSVFGGFGGGGQVRIAR